MNIHRNKSDRSGVFYRQLPLLIVIFLLTFSEHIAYAQTELDAGSQKVQDVNKYTSEYQPGILPLFFEREPPVGTVYFTEYWMRGAAEFANHRTIPTRENRYYFNFDKMKNVLIVVDNSANVSYYHGNEVIEFILLDSMNKTYRFDIVPAISRAFFLQPVLISDSGYSLYKRLITKLTPADFQSYGYGTTGTKHDTYDDSYEYYILYPDKKTYRKFYLDGAAKKVFKAWPVEFDKLIGKNADVLNENALIELVEMINKTH